MASAPGAPAAEPHKVLPDIVTLRVKSDDLNVESSNSNTQLRLTNRIANKGRGPLEIYPSANSHGCDGDGDPDNDRDAIQRIFLDTNGDRVFERKSDTESEHFTFGCDRYDPHAHHWDVFDLARYALRRLRSGRTVAKASKVAFCTVDSDPEFPWLPGSPNVPYYPQGGCDGSSILGVSVGWADEYYYRLPGQALNITGLKGGRFCLVSTGDPSNLLRESNNSNNRRRTRIELRPAKQLVKTLPGPCRIGR
jgi:Lysyl oxidase